MNEFIRKLADPLFFKENRLGPHSDHVVYAPEDDGTESSFRKSLNGVWKFHYASNFDGMPDEFEMAEYDVSGWDDIRVPGHIQLQGYDSPQYVNTQYPWDGREEIDPGQIPVQFNPVGSYVTSFKVPGSFEGKRVFISFQGVESSFRLWLNGSYVGFSSDSFTPSEFEVTSYLKDQKEGKNRLAVQVYKWYSGSWLEDQDFFRFSGIFRDVYLYAVPEHHVWDVKVEADYETSLEPEMPSPVAGELQGSQGTMSGETHVDGSIRLTLTGALSRSVLQLELADPDGRSLEQKVLAVESERIPAMKMAPPVSGAVKIPDETDGEMTAPETVTTDFSIPDPMLWSAEKPALYTVKVTVCDLEGRAQEWFTQRIGIRHFEMDGNIMKLNGKRIVFKGVNRHEFSIDSGRVVSREDLLTDLYTMKRNNINAIRLCHYPNSSAIYELADELGFYLIDECNMETHGSWDSIERKVRPADYAVPGSHMEYQEMLLDRIRSMVERDKNHPCILIWSCGNESFGGPVIHAMSQELKRLDPSRLVHYEGIFHDRSFNDTSDMESQMYPYVSMIKEFLSEHRDKPFICCEYMHAMGNSCGALYKYTSLAEEDPLYQGGFIWDYIDQAIRTKDRYGCEFFGYGGDFGDRPNDGNFSGNGIVYGDRTPTPKMAEVKYCYQNIAVQIFENSFTVVNKNLFTNTDEYSCEVILEKDGYPVRKELVETAVPAQSSSSYPLHFVIPEEPGEYAVTVRFYLKYGTVWAEAGHEVAFGQRIFRRLGLSGADATWMDLSACSRSEHAWRNKSSACDRTSGKKLQVIHGSYNIGVKGEDFEVLFSKLYGGLVSYRYKGKELLAGTVKPNFWRAPTDNDRGNMMPFRCAQWKTASLYPDSRDYHDPAAAFCMVNPILYEPESSTLSKQPVPSDRQEGVSVVYKYYLPTVPMHSVQLIYTVMLDGTVKMDLVYEPPKDGAFPEMPEFGVMLKMDADYDQMEWYGRGPGDCYLDRRDGCKVGIWQSTAVEATARYLKPQESGNHTDVRWMKVTDEEGHGLLFSSILEMKDSQGEEMSVARDGLDVSVSPWSPHELEEALHPTELPPVHYTYVRIGQQMGIGGDDSWGAPVHEEFLLKADQSRRVSFIMKGI